MRIPKYWQKASYAGRDARGKELTFSAWGWSCDGAAQAEEHAISRARKVFDRLVNGRRPDAYEYGECPLREEIVETIRHGSKEVAVVTRNRYGALVLNTASVLFADVDFPPIAPTGLWDAILLSLSSSRRKWRKAAARELTLEAVRDWAQRHPGHCVRVYRTYAGLRLLFVDKLYDPNAEETARILSELGSDPLYCTLTSKQECFRARLTPKPWRCGSDTPPNAYPWKDAFAERRYRDWERRYTDRIGAYKVCDLLEVCGRGAVNGQVAGIVELHDRLACHTEDKRLA